MNRLQPPHSDPEPGALLASLEASVAPAMPPVRFSHLKRIGESPAHYQAALTEDHRDSASMRIGRIVDSALLGGRPVIPWTGKTRFGKKWEAFRARHSADKEIVSLREYETAYRCAEALTRHKDAMYLLQSGTPKTRLYWDFLGRNCSGEPDVHGRYLVDLKTSVTANPGRFQRMARGFAYHAQLAWYRLGMIESGLPAPEACFNVVVETRAPYPVTVFELTPRALVKGEILCRGWMERLLGCERVNTFPAYSQSRVDFDVPDDDELTFGDETEEAA